MRTVTYGAACSLDGYIAGADGAVDWLHFSRDVQAIMAEYWATIDTALMGRKTWDVTVAQGGGGGGAGLLSGIATYVVSRTPQDLDARGVERVATDPGAFVRDLKRRAGRGICLLGGGELAQSLFEADVIDEVRLNIHPILLGAGVPLFRDPGRRISLLLVEARQIAGGCVVASYRVRHAS